VIWLAETLHKLSARMMQVINLKRVVNERSDRRNLAFPDMTGRLIMVLSSLVWGSRTGESRLAR
jgi:hypothetical protein